MRSLHDDDADMESIIAHIEFDQRTNSYVSANSNSIVEIEATVTPFSPRPDPRCLDDVPSARKTNIKIFPDSGASICLGGPKHLECMGLKVNNLIASKKVVRAVGGSTITCKGWLPVQFAVGEKSTKQALYICENIEKLYFSKTACIDVGILPPHFPTPMTTSPRCKANWMSGDSTSAACITNVKQQSPHLQLPIRPTETPFPANEENVDNLKTWLLEQFANSAFNNDGRFPAMSAQPAHIHLKDGAVAKARHNPIPVPYHFKEPVRQALMKDVERGILKPVPIGMPTDWCSTMVITTKKDGRPRRTIDYQHLNSQCKRETHHTGSPFQLALQVPPNTKKTVLDAVDGYHSILLDEESQPLTTFITEWGRFLYLRMPQGYLASGDAYTRRYDEVIKDIPRKVKIIDDALLYDSGIKEAFFHTFDFLVTCAQNGIVLSKDKFQFCKDTVQFGGLQITPSGVAPSESLLNAILDFPVPKTITDARSWFGLVNQLAWAYSLSPIMLPFRDLVKKESKFIWNQTLEKAFQESKQTIVKLVRKGVSTFDTKRITCLAPDWSKEGMGFLLLQKYCTCPVEKAPVCCPEGWHLVFAGSRFCTDAERRYAPIEGEAAAISWALEKCRMFVLGCPNVMVVTDHEPLKGLFGDRDLSKIHNPRLFRLKEKTLRYRFTMHHCPGRWHRGPDAVSRNPVAMVQALRITSPMEPSPTDIDESAEICATITSVALASISEFGSDATAISPDHIRAAGRKDTQYTTLINAIGQGFPNKRQMTVPAIREYWEVRHRLSTDKGLILMDRRVVIPTAQRKDILRCLHSAHQGVVGMKSRASESVYWPGMNASIRNYRANCITCSRIAPSQPQEPISMTPSPEWPFQQIVMDLFYIGPSTYLVCADRLTGWLILYNIKPGQAIASRLISICRGIFQTYGAPEELSTDGGPPFSSHSFRQFLETWAVMHRISSVAYPQSNGRAELAVKTAKRLLNNCIGPHGSLDNNLAARAILQYRNTPIQGIGLSPAQLLLHRRLRDFIPAQPYLYKPHPEWVDAAIRRERGLSRRNTNMTERYNRTSHNLHPLSEGDSVSIQDPHNRRWSMAGRVVEALPNRQYRVRVAGSGRVTLRNRRFLRKLRALAAPAPIPSALPVPSDIGAPIQQPEGSDATPPHGPGSPGPINTPQPMPTRIPRALSRLFPCNKPGRKELLPPQRPLRPRNGGEEI